MRTHRRLFDRFQGVPFTLAAAALAAMAAASPARGQGSGGAAPTASWKDSLLKEAGELRDAVKGFTHKHFGDVEPMARLNGVYVLKADGVGRSAGDWVPLADAGTLPERVVLLVHGLDDTGDVWDDLVPAIRQRQSLQTVGVARLEYPNDQAIADSAAILDNALTGMSAAGAGSVDLVCHSMGGLIARDVLTRPEFYHGTPTGHRADATPRPDLRQIILLGTPNLGAPLAKVRGLTEARETISRWIDSENLNLRDLFRSEIDGDGKAGRDLLPESDYLKSLNARPLPPASVIPVTNIIGRVVTAEDLKLEQALSLPIVKKVLGETEAEDLLESCRDLTRGLGDGVVSVKSAWLDGAQETIFVEATHRAMVREVSVFGTGKDKDNPAKVPPAIPYILGKLE